jgi:hypothetical protein
VPTFVFGEKWLYNRKELPKWFTRFFMKTMRLPLILFWGRFGTWIPYRRMLSVVYGKPISVKQTAEPTQEEVPVARCLPRAHTDALLWCT